jgi:hypothetical protein
VVVAGAEAETNVRARLRTPRVYTTGRLDTCPPGEIVKQLDEIDETEERFRRTLA